MIDHTHDPAASSWVAGADAHPDFPVQNLPLGVFCPPGEGPRIGTVIGDHCLDLAALASILPAELRAALEEPALNALFALPGQERAGLRFALFALLTDPVHRPGLEAHLYPVESCSARLPVRIGDYTDFYVGIHHATNVGRLFRPDTPLLPNYKHVPIGYHGRASSVRPSPSDVIRPGGQIKPAAEQNPQFLLSKQLDYELELGAWIAGENALGEPVPIANAWERIGGLTLLNDWSARDIQAWEYQPLGPFLAKNFLTTVSPWIITTEALAPFRVPAPPRQPSDPSPLPYLVDAQDQATGALALALDVSLSTPRMRGAKIPAVRVGQSNAAYMYWTFAQIVTHHASNGCNLIPGDLLGTGTISGPHAGSEGSLLERTRAGTDPLSLPTGEIRRFLEDGDQVTLSARAERTGFRSIGFGACTGTVRPGQ